jgi:hypothetical protein
MTGVPPVGAAVRAPMEEKGLTDVFATVEST